MVGAAEWVSVMVLLTAVGSAAVLDLLADERAEVMLEPLILWIPDFC